MKLLNNNHIAVFIILYLTSSFLELDINFTNWSKDIRLFNAVTYLTYLICYYVVKILDKVIN